MASNESLKGVIEFTCPFCQRKAWAGKRKNTHEGVVLHELPMCDEFTKDTSPADYLAAVNAKLRTN